VQLALKTLVGRDTDQDLSAFESKEILVQLGTPRVNVSADGEVSVMDAPLHYTIRPKALRVIVPAQRRGHER
jgi:diacylglycerol kinase family enzyme